jgi:histone deacetylase complex regulatory component SIN3
MKKRDDVQPFHNTARVSVSSTRILTPPQQQQMNASSVNSSPSQNQFQILNVLRDSGSSMTTQTQNIQYTYTSSPTISIATNVHKNNISQQSASQQSQASNVNTPNLPNRAKNANTGTIASAQISTNPVNANALTPPNISGQNFPRLKVEDALSYLDQVRFFSLLLYLSSIN